MDEKDKELNDMPIWQNHEQRITALEVTMSGVSEKMDRVDATIRDGNKEQKEMLDKINTRMVDEFFGRKKTDHKYKWKIISAIVGGMLGGGGLFYVVLDKFF